MDERDKHRPVAGWYMPAAVASLLFMLLAGVAFAMHLAADPASLAVDQRALHDADPGWVSGALGLGAVAGVVGAVLLILRKNAAPTILAVSMLAVLLWFAGLLLVPGLRDLLSTTEIAFALAVVAVTWTIFGFARRSRQYGWLR